FRVTLDQRVREFGDASDTRLSALRRDLNDGAAQARTETRQGFTDFQTAVRTALEGASMAQGRQLADFAQTFDKVNDNLVQQLDKTRQTVETKPAELHAK